MCHQSNEFQQVKILVESGPDVDTPDGWALLHYAVDREQDIDDDEQDTNDFEQATGEEKDTDFEQATRSIIDIFIGSGANQKACNWYYHECWISELYRLTLSFIIT